MKKYLFLLYFALPLASLAQTRSTNLWTGISASKRIIKKFSLEATAQWRVVNNFTATGAYLGELGANYKFNKHFEISGFYRFISRNKFDKGDAAYVYKTYHRFYGNLTYDRKVSFLKLTYRLRYQNQFRDDNGVIENNKSYLRNRLEVAYPNKSRFTPAVSADLFYRIGEAFDEVRYKAEVDYKFNKKNTLTLGGFIAHEFTDATQLDDFTILLMYKIKL